jgi:hypothetical protein
MGCRNTLGGVEFPFGFLEIFKCFSQVSDELIMRPCLDYHIVDIFLGVAPDLPLEASLDGLLVGCTYVLESEHHGVVAVRPEGGDERGRSGGT